MVRLIVEYRINPCTNTATNIVDCASERVKLSQRRRFRLEEGSENSRDATTGFMERSYDNHSEMSIAAGLGRHSRQLSVYGDDLA
jgi:hypothetical protein